MALRIAMRSLVLALALFLGSGGILAQQEPAGQAGPYTSQETQRMIAVWGKSAELRDTKISTGQPSVWVVCPEARKLRV